MRPEAVLAQTPPNPEDKSNLDKNEAWSRQTLLGVGTSNPLEVKRKRFPPMGSRSVDLVKGLSSPLLCAPAARRPAHLLGCSACLASPQLLAQLLASGHHSASPVYPSCLHLRRWCAYSGHLPLEAPTASRTSHPRDAAARHLTEHRSSLPVLLEVPRK
jgi:hypothetical protein